jgi:hypothetical protein
MPPQSERRGLTPVSHKKRKKKVASHKKHQHDEERGRRKKSHKLKKRERRRLYVIAAAVFLAAVAVVLALVLVSKFSNNDILGISNNNNNNNGASSSSTGASGGQTQSTITNAPPSSSSSASLRAGASSSSSAVGGGPGPASVVYLYPPPPLGTNTSFQYTASVSTNTTNFQITPYQSWNPSLAGLDTSALYTNYKAWISFAFTGAVNVTIQSTWPFASARVLPTSYGITGTKNGNAFTFQITQPCRNNLDSNPAPKPCQLAIDWCYQGSPCVEQYVNLTYPMFIFADDFASLVPAPNLGSSQVQTMTPGVQSTFALSGGKSIAYYGPGFYWLPNAPFVLDSGQQMYFAAGSFVVGSMTTTSGGTSSSLVGQGVFSGAYNSHCAKATPGTYCAVMATTLPTSCTFWMQGITIVEPPEQVLSSACGSGTLLDNVKVITWHPNTAFVATGSNTIARNCFVNCGDTAVHFRLDNMVIYDSVFWQMANFGVFTQFGGNTGVSLYNTDVIRTEWYGVKNENNLQASVFSAFYTGTAGDTTNFYFNNIHIENAGYQLFKIQVGPLAGQTSMSPVWDNFTFSNIYVTDTQLIDNMLLYYSPLYPWTDMVFSNFYIAGQRVDTTLHIGVMVDRAMSLLGNFQYQLPLSNPSDPTKYQVWDIVDQTLTNLVQPLFNSTFKFQGLGEYFGNGFASFVMRSGTTLGIWRVDNGNNAYTQLGTQIPSGFHVVHTNGDYNGDGYTDILLFNNVTQVGQVWLITPSLSSTTPQVVSWQPNSALSSVWQFAGVTDVNADGYSDVMLNAPGVGVEVVFFGAGGAMQYTLDTLLSSMTYAIVGQVSLSSFSGHPTGSLDASWLPVSGGNYGGLTYGGLMMLSTTTFTNVWGTQWRALAFLGWNGYSTSGGAPNWAAINPSPLVYGLNTTQVVAATGDVNSDSADDVILHDTVTGAYYVVYNSLQNGGNSAIGGVPSFIDAFSVTPTAGYVPCWKPL